MVRSAKVEKPKSISFTASLASSANNQLVSVKSRCTILLACKYLIHFAICSASTRQYSSE